MKSFMGLVQGATCRLEVEFKDDKGQPYKRTAVVKGKGTETEEVPLFTNKDNIQGEIKITPTTNKKVEHQGIRVQLVGVIEVSTDKSNPSDFVSLVRELAPAGELTSARVLPFEFRNVEMQYDSYRGQGVRCRYYLKVTVVGKGITPDSKKEFAFGVRNYEALHEATAPIKMEVGIEDCLHIEFEYDKAKYHLKDVVVGKIYFLLVRIKLKHMEIEIRRRETTGMGSAAHSESETLAKYEIMDGAPVRNENIPIRLYLSPYDLTPTYKDVHNKFSARYYLNLVLVDEEDRRYFKQQEITLYRKLEGQDGDSPGNGPPPGLHNKPPPALGGNWTSPNNHPSNGQPSLASQSSIQNTQSAIQPPSASAASASPSVGDSPLNSSAAAAGTAYVPAPSAVAPAVAQAATSAAASASSSLAATAASASPLSPDAPTQSTASLTSAAPLTAAAASPLVPVTPATAPFAAEEEQQGTGGGPLFGGMEEEDLTVGGSKALAPEASS